MLHSSDFCKEIRVHPRSSAVSFCSYVFLNGRCLFTIISLGRVHARTGNRSSRSGNKSFLDGGKFSLSGALARGPVVVAFFKVSCPVCQLAFPYLERIFKAYSKDGKFTLVGISQDNAKDTQAFNRQFGVTFPALLDEKKYPVSNAYGLTNVPTIFV